MRIDVIEAQPGDHRGDQVARRNSAQKLPKFTTACSRSASRSPRSITSTRRSMSSWSSTSRSAMTTVSHCKSEDVYGAIDEVVQ